MIPEMSAPKLRPIRTMPRHASVTRREVAAAVKAVAAARKQMPEVPSHSKARPSVARRRKGNG
jgi:hypothetical protein